MEVRTRQEIAVKSWEKEPVSIEEKEMFFADVEEDAIIHKPAIINQDLENIVADMNIARAERNGKESKEYEAYVDLKNKLKERSQKPPLGLEPRRYWDLTRRDNIREAIIRHVQANCELPPEWVEEWNERCGS